MTEIDALQITLNFDFGMCHRLEMIEFMKAILPLNCEFEVTGDIPEQT